MTSRGTSVNNKAGMLPIKPLPGLIPLPDIDQFNGEDEVMRFISEFLNEN